MRDEQVRLWHDDVRPAPDGWLWAKTNAAAMEVLAEYEVDEISLDHDLGAVPTGDMDPRRYMTSRGSAEETGVDLARWMVEFDRVPPRITIHSWNPPGAERIAAVLTAAGHPCLIKPFVVPDA